MLKKVLTTILCLTLVLTSTCVAFATASPDDRFVVKYLDFNKKVCMYDRQTNKYYVKWDGNGQPERESLTGYIPEEYFNDMTGINGWEEFKIPDNFYDSQTVIYNGKEYQIYANNKELGAYINGELDKDATRYVEMAWHEAVANGFIAGFENVSRLVFSGAKGDTVGRLLECNILIEVAGKIFPATLSYAEETDDIEYSTWWASTLNETGTNDLSTLLGDAAMNGDLDMLDVTATQKSIAKLDAECNTVLADMDENGEVDLRDVVVMQRKIAKL